MICQSWEPWFSVTLYIRMTTDPGLQQLGKGAHLIVQERKMSIANQEQVQADIINMHTKEDQAIHTMIIAHIRLEKGKQNILEQWMPMTRLLPDIEMKMIVQDTMKAQEFIMILEGEAM